MSNIVEIKVPDIGDFKEVEVIEVLVSAGDTIKAEQSLITVESDKASMEIPASAAGVVKSVKVKVGDKIAEGTVILEVEAAGEAAAAPRMTVPSATLSPTLTLTDFTTPADEAGISIDALSDSTVIRLCSALMVSPAATSTSMTSTSLKSPMSGTLISTILLIDCPRYSAMRRKSTSSWPR